MSITQSLGEKDVLQVALILTLFCLVFGWYSPGDLLAAGSLPVRYMAEDGPEAEPEADSSSSDSHIDNQAYLREFEQRRRSRASGHSATMAGVVVEKRYRGFSFPTQVRQHPRCRDNRTTFFEYQNGASSIRYYDGYLPPRYTGSQSYITVQPPVTNSCIEP